MSPKPPQPALSRRLLLGGMALLLPAPLRAQGAAIGAATQVTGTVTASLGSKRRSLSQGADLFLREVLTTAEAGHLILQLQTGITITLGARSRLRLDLALLDQGTSLALEDGALFLERAAGPPPAPVTVASPYALIATRGTQFFAGDLDGQFSVFVERGTVEVVADGLGQRLDQGQGLDIAQPGAEAGPVKTWGAAKIARAQARISPAA